MRTLIFLLLSAVTCVDAGAGISIVATTADLGSIAREIAGDNAAISTLALPTEDSHFVDPKPSFIRKLNQADVLIEGGADLESGWLPALLDKTRNARIKPGAPGHIRAAEGVQLLEIPSTLDRSKGDIHALGNPHFLTDPANARVVAEHVAKVLCQIDAGSQETYQSNLKKFTSRVDARLAEWDKKMAPFHGRHLVSYHNSWPYFARRFNLTIDLFLEPKPGIPPSPSHLAEVESKMRQQNVRVILVEPYLNQRTAAAVAGKTGATVLPVSQFPGGVKGTETGYIELMDYMIKSLAQILAASNSAK